MKLARGVFLACIVCGFVALFSTLRSSQNLIEGDGETGRFETDEDIRLEGLQYSEWKEERLVWSLGAKRAQYRHKEQEASFDQVEVIFFPASGGKMFLWADLVVYDLQTRDLVARDSVRGKSHEGYRFATESLFYDADKEEVATDDKVRLEKDRLTIQGVGMKGCLTDHRFALLSAVSAVFSPQGTVP